MDTAMWLVIVLLSSCCGTLAGLAFAAWKVRRGKFVIVIAGQRYLARKVSDTSLQLTHEIGRWP